MPLYVLGIRKKKVTWRTQIAIRRTFGKTKLAVEQNQAPCCDFRNSKHGCGEYLQRIISSRQTSAGPGAIRFKSKSLSYDESCCLHLFVCIKPNDSDLRLREVTLASFDRTHNIVWITATEHWQFV